MLNSFILEEMLPISHRINYIHLIEQKSNSAKSIIIVTTTYQCSVFQIYMYRYTLDGQCIQQQSYAGFIKRVESEGQIGVLLLSNGQIQIINWLTFQMILTIENQQIKLNEPMNKYMSCLLLTRDLYHALPPNLLQLDCQPQISAPSLPCAVIICEYGLELFIYHVRLNEFALMNSIAIVMDEEAIIPSMDMFRGD
jgi:hypothetical protein